MMSGGKATAKPKMAKGGAAPKKKYAMAGTTSTESKRGDGIFSRIFKKKGTGVNFKNPIDPSMCRGSNCGKQRKKTPGL